MALIETRQLEKIYRDETIETIGLTDLNLRIEAGEYVAIIGPSGSGKSTLLQILGCLDRPSTGQYFLDGKELNTFSDNELAQVRNQTMGFVFQSFNLLPRLSVLENVKLPLIYANLDEATRTIQAKKFVALVGLADRTDYLVSKLSGGQKQRVAIARALVNSPKVIFADEPTGSLDSKSGEAVLNFLDDLHRQGHTIVLVTHESYVAERAQRILHIRDGRVEKDELVNGRQIGRDSLLK